MQLDDLLRTGVAPVVAILRGVTPAEAIDIGAALIEAGICMIEVPLNSPEPLHSIEHLQARFGDVAMIGAGTVLNPDAAQAVAAAGGRFIVTPNTDVAVIKRAVELGLEPMPGFFTATEAFAAVAAGAQRLKLFPAGSSAPDHIKSLRDVLPAHVQIWAVGGTGAASFARWLDCGATGIGVGGGLYRPGDSAAIVAERARDIIAAWQATRR